jgi:hypothetical protein
MKLKDLGVATLILAFSAASQPAWAQQGPSKVIDRAEMDQVLAAKVASDEGSRATIRALLERAEVRSIADEVGLDLRRAEGAVSTLQGPELDRVASQASAANDMLAGGQNIKISLVAILLIIIIVILLVD